jgi:Raf kinase inhibitor-like YbhB/YbcL family protein
MLQLTSSAFAPGDAIPVVHTCEGDDTSPPLDWAGVPDGTRTLALVVDDPDAPGGTFVHWLVANLPSTPNQLPEDADVREQSAGAQPGPVEGVNDFGRLGYGGPCPPRGHGPHRYQFRLYALDDVVQLAAGFTRDELARAIGGHVLAEVEIVGTYEREG